MIKEIVGMPAAYEQLAEECTELAKAALKMARILRKENPTPTTEDEAQKDIAEEWTDVTLCAKDLGLEISKDIAKDKLERFFDRVTGKKADQLDVPEEPIEHFTGEIDIDYDEIPMQQTVFEEVVET